MDRFLCAFTICDALFSFLFSSVLCFFSFIEKKMLDYIAVSLQKKEVKREKKLFFIHTLLPCLMDGIAECFAVVSFSFFFFVVVASVFFPCFQGPLFSMMCNDSLKKKKKKLFPLLVGCCCSVLDREGFSFHFVFLHLLHLLVDSWCASRSLRKGEQRDWQLLSKRTPFLFFFCLFFFFFNLPLLQ